jgi:hypothetical protein
MLLKICQKFVKKWFKAGKKSCQKVVKKCSKSFQKIVKKLSKFFHKIVIPIKHGRKKKEKKNRYS